MTFVMVRFGVIVRASVSVRPFHLVIKRYKPKARDNARRAGE